MHVSGKDITHFDIKIKPDFSPKTVYALKWSQLSNGLWCCVDRGAASDTYDAEIRLYGIESVINNFINEVDKNRYAQSHVLVLSDFNSQEHIFGADVDYSTSLVCTAIMQRRTQKTWKGFGVSLKLSLLSPSFVGGVGSLPVLRFLDIGYDADADYTVNKFESYRGVFSYEDHNADDGSFTGVFTFTDEEMIALRRFIATNRGNAFEIPAISGVDYPFGRIVADYLSDPGWVKLISFEDMGMYSLVKGLPRWRAKLTIASYVPPE